ncbi:hypothetical protein PBI_TERROR_48 [Mycobacterium phage Terror]|uniref:Uncharacterized protein n=1 Tax=Mycobacterium phage Taheera TaxID=1897549 RepID=A0A1D8EVT6_9CAUD|nr:hypothetical protein KDW70_gp48 [Mycobacterium phage Taheera]AOT25159.1 hypothetical protein PBI_TAHEERA_48 [Mycobacterium phage Taheera]AOT25217.1 hypothetical protein PBI_TERROR_48 [Mycobacterium phage Terror]
MTARNENVAIFNPLVLPLPSWQPDGPDGMIDGFLIPFVFVEQRKTGPVPNRRAHIRVYPTEHGWRAALRNCQDHAETAEQARAFAAAWIRAAELLENVKAGQPADVDEDQRAGNVSTPESEPRRDWCCGTPVTKPHTPGCSFEPREDNPVDYNGPATVLRKPPRLPGEPKSSLLAESDPPVALHPDDERRARRLGRGLPGEVDQ